MLATEYESRVYRLRERGVNVSHCMTIFKELRLIDKEDRLAIVHLPNVRILPMTKTHILFAVLLLSLLPCFGLSQDEASTNIFIPRLSSEIKLDGRLNEWQSLRPMNMSTKGLVRGAGWSGRLDLSMTTWLTWDDRGLYFAVDLVDDDFQGVGRGGQLWNSDCVIITLQPPEDEEEGKLYYLVFSMKNGQVVSSLLYGKGAVFSRKEANSLQVVARNREDYAPLFEGFIGWADLSSMGIAESPARLNFNLEARDVQKRGQIKSISWMPSEQIVGSGIKLSMAALGQNGRGSGQERRAAGRGSFYGSVQLVQIPVSVTDEEGKFIKDLKAEDFQLTEDGSEQKIEEIVLEKRPITVGLVMDSSGSMKTYIHSAKNAAKTFLESVRLEDRIFVVAFNDNIELLKDFDGGVEETKEAIDGIRPEGSTMLYAGLLFSVNKVKYIREKKVIILFSDGKDESAGLRNPYGKDLNMDLIIEEAKRSDLAVYAIAFRLSDVIAETELNQLVEETGGRIFQTSDTEGMIEAYEKIAEELKSQYLISYVSTNHEMDGAWREIKLAVKERDYQVRTKKGYYAPRR